MEAGARAGQLVRAGRGKLHDVPAAVGRVPPAGNKPEYNHSVPAVLKNAIDSVWLSFGFRNKPVAAQGDNVSLCVGHNGNRTRMIRLTAPL
ncbi:MAG: NADPH-dependent FMN reductase [Streptosporangiaceae bacterium]